MPFITEKSAQGHRTMGRKEGAYTPDPRNFLRRRPHDFAPRTPERALSDRGGYRKPPVPLRNEQNQLVRRVKDFVQENAETAIATRTLHRTQSEARYVEKPNYGRVPSYLEKRAAELREKQDAAASEEAVLKEEHSQLLTGQDLLDLVASLEEKQKRLMSTFNQLPCLVMTTTRKREKEYLERELKLVEGQLQVLSGAKAVRVIMS